MKTFLLPLLAGAAAGLLTGAGVGGGTALLLWLTGPGGFSQPQAQGINLLYYLACAPAALVQHKRSGLFRWDAARPAILAGLPAAGEKTSRMPPRRANWPGPSTMAQRA